MPQGASSPLTEILAMRTETIALPVLSPGAAHQLTVHRFGTAGARPHVHIQAALHADEIPGMICAVHLRELLAALEAAGKLLGSVTLVPVANPLGLGQVLFGHGMGRFAFGDGGNFNRDYPHLTPGAATRLEGRLGADPLANVAMIREALTEELEQWTVSSQVGTLKKELVRLALGADIVLDLHCDAEGALHLYTQPTSAETFASLGARLGSLATLVALESGGDPFDEVVSRPWVELAARFPDAAIPLGCQSTTVELRGQADVSHEFAASDAAAIIGFLHDQGILEGDAAAPAFEVPPVTALESAEPLTAARAGIIIYRAAAGERIEAGQCVAEIVDPLTGAVTPVVAQSEGVLFARSSSRFATPGKRLGKIAGASLKRTGKLLSQ
jgi:predicted deacylase